MQNNPQLPVTMQNPPPSDACVAGCSANLTGSMNRVCAWCQTPLGIVSCLPELDGKTTHGMCENCAVKQIYPELVQRIEVADKHDLTAIILFDLPNVNEDEYRKTLLAMAQKRAEQLKN